MPCVPSPHLPLGFQGKASVTLQLAEGSIRQRVGILAERCPRYRIGQPLLQVGLDRMLGLSGIVDEFLDDAANYGSRRGTQVPMTQIDDPLIVPRTPLRPSGRSISSSHVWNVPIPEEIPVTGFGSAASPSRMAAARRTGSAEDQQMLKTGSKGSRNRADPRLDNGSDDCPAGSNPVGVIQSALSAASISPCFARISRRTRADSAFEALRKATLRSRHGRPATHFARRSVIRLSGKLHAHALARIGVQTGSLASCWSSRWSPKIAGIRTSAAGSSPASASERTRTFEHSRRRLICIPKQRARTPRPQHTPTRRTSPP